MDFVHTLRDNRIKCDSTLISLSVRDYLSLIEKAYEEKGGIAFQRSALKTKTAKTIRQRLVTDVSRGAVIPPIVLGVLCDPAIKAEITNATNGSNVLNILKDLPPELISIIDGMQRTTALREASDANAEILEQKIRLEIWSTEEISSLVYRMLILNTGQVPWEISRQLETIYSQLVNVVRRGAPDYVEIFYKDEGRRRRSAGQYQASTLIRLFLSFSARRAEFDLKDRVAEDFARLDAIESTSHEELTDYFTRTFNLMAALDSVFSKDDQPLESKSSRISCGRDFFSSEPALTGLFVSVALKLLDAPGFDTDWSKAEEKMSNIEETVASLIDRISGFNSVQTAEFLELEILNDRLNQRSGQVGRFEKDLFVRAFTMLIERGADLQNMKPCWMI